MGGGFPKELLLEIIWRNSMQVDEIIKIHIQNCKREIEDLQRTKNIMVNETARKAIDLHLDNLESEIYRSNQKLRTFENRNS